MELEISDSAFVRGHDGKQSQFLLWPKSFPQSHFDKMAINQDYNLNCVIKMEDVTVYVGEIHAKRRQQSGFVDVLVLMLQDMDLGRLLPTASIELDVSAFA